MDDLVNSSTVKFNTFVNEYEKNLETKKSNDIELSPTMSQSNKFKAVNLDCKF